MPELGWLQAPDYWLTRLVLLKALAATYLVAFWVARNQFKPLLGENGLTPVPDFLERVPFRHSPGLFHLTGYSDRLASALIWTGLALSAATLAGLPDLLPAWVSIPAWLALWALYLSIVNVGQTWYSFGWETLLLEAGFLAVLFGSGSTAPPSTLVVLFRWLLFRVEFGAGLIKLRGDSCWRDLTCLYHHHETQPMPNPLSWYFHHLPRRFHRLEVLGNHFAQLVVPWLLFTPQPVASLAGLVIVLTQGWLVLSGNFSWLNFLTMALALSAFDDRSLGLVLRLHVPHEVALPGWWQVAVLAFTLFIAVLSYRPARNLLSRRQLMNSSFDPLHLVNTYGAFGSVTKERYEVALEGSDDPRGGEWLEYEFRAKPGDVRRRPPQCAPYHLRLDWLMWFAAMDTPLRHPWLLALIAKLLQADRAALRLLRRSPFGDRPPKAIRAKLYLYRFSTPAEHRETGDWWVREPAGDYLPVMSLDAAGGLRRGF